MLAFVLMASRVTASDPTDAVFAKDIWASLNVSCLKCHGDGEDPEGGVNLARLSSVDALEQDLDLLRELIEVLELGVMPPEDEPQLAAHDQQKLVTGLRDLLHQTIRARSDSPPTPIRRMNRFQYSNAVEDLFDLNVEVFALPERMMRSYGYFKPETSRMPDQLKAGSRPLGKSQLINKRLAGVAPFPQDLRAEHGFDNRADHLSLSPLILESFLKLSGSIVNSPDFNEATCGIWQDMFAPPPADSQTEAVIRGRLNRFLTHAFRRPIDAESLDRYAAHVTAKINSGQSFTTGMKSAASAALASPKFLYLYSRPNAAETSDAFELASRLSFFLWGSIPDQTLLDLAADGTLRDPRVLDEQFERMLADARLKRFCDSFPSQWLQLERIISSVPDRERNPEFYFAKFRVSMHMMLEPLLLFETILVEDRSILELIDSNYSYRSELLESWYRDGTQGRKTTPVAIPFKRVAVTDRRQGGVITNAAVMTMTSGALRTKPITRGAWIASVIFNDPPDPPPADVPLLPEEVAKEDRNMTLRERFEIHRKRADCAGCHAQIDPLGFALENYGPTGIWRDTYDNGRNVDSSGVLFRKHQFKNIVEFKDAILAEKERFAAAFSAHVLSFALGREVGAADALVIDQIVEDSARSGYRLRSLMKSVIHSKPFRGNTMRTPE